MSLPTPSKSPTPTAPSSSAPRGHRRVTTTLPQDTLEEMVTETAVALGASPDVIYEVVSTLDDQNPVDVFNAMIELEAYDVSTLRSHLMGSTAIDYDPDVYEIAI